MKNLLLITMLLGVGYSQCNESNWQEYYPNMAYCDLQGADLSGADLWGATLDWANLCNLAGSPSGDVCEESVTDNNGDGYDDVSYDAGAQTGDVNLDGELNIFDLVQIANYILDSTS